jgi:hypothetical protein
MEKSPSLPKLEKIEKSPSIEKGKRLFFALIGYLIEIEQIKNPYEKKRIKEDLKNTLVDGYNKTKALEYRYKFERFLKKEWKNKGFFINHKNTLSLMSFYEIREFLDFTFATLGSYYELKPFEVCRLYWVCEISKEELIVETKEFIDLLPDWAKKLHKNQLKGGKKK